MKNLESTSKKFQKDLDYKSLKTKSESAIFKKIVFLKRNNSDILIELASKIKLKYKYLR